MQFSFYGYCFVDWCILCGSIFTYILGGFTFIGFMRIYAYNLTLVRTKCSSGRMSMFSCAANNVVFLEVKYSGIATLKRSIL